MHPIRSEEDLTHHRKGPLGDMAVVPDGYVGPMPPGAVRETDYQRMVSVYGHIDSGKSSIQFDTSNFTDGINPITNPVEYLEAVQSADGFKQQYMGYIQDLVKTPAGLQMLETLDQSKFKTKIEHLRPDPDRPDIEGNSTLAEHPDRTQEDASHRPNVGSGSTVTVDSNALLWDAEMPTTGWQPWMKDRPRFGFYHELVHAYHNARGDAAPGGHGHVQSNTEFPWELGNVEWQAAGLGPWAGASVSENAIRAQMGVPLRPTYSGGTYDGPDFWGQQKDDEDPLRAPPPRRR